MSRGLAALLLPALVALLPGSGSVRAQEEPPPVAAPAPEDVGQPAPHGDGEGPQTGPRRQKAEEGLFLFVIGPGILALFTYPVGLAAHCLIMAHAPRRAAPLVHRLEAHRWKTLLLGLANSMFLGIVVAATQQHAKPIALLAGVLWWALAFVGTHGIARAIGARVLGHDPGLPPAPPGDLKALAVGWFVVVFASAIPAIGPFLGLYWCLRGAGGVVLAVFSVPEPPAPVTA